MASKRTSAAKRKLSGPAPSSNAAGTKVKRGEVYAYRLRVSGAVVQSYEQQAAMQKCDIEEVMEQRLADAADSPDVGLVFDSKQRDELRQLLDTSTSDPGVLLDRIRRLVQISVADIAVQLTPTELERVTSRVFPGQTFAKVVSDWALYGIRSNIGLA